MPSALHTAAMRPKRSFARASQIHIAAVDEGGELGFRGAAAEPRLPVGLVACLVQLRRVDAEAAILDAVSRPERVAVQ
ncbi:MAG: hypothetical protein H7X74_02240 [Methyloceanibacter sp.]|nr:hypothetical protein [Methyloceanibacter sp.]